MAIFLGIGAIVCAHWVMFYTSIKLGNIPRDRKSTCQPHLSQPPPHLTHIFFPLITSHCNLSVSVCLSLFISVSVSHQSVSGLSIFVCLCLTLLPPSLRRLRLHHSGVLRLRVLLLCRLRTSSAATALLSAGPGCGRPRAGGHPLHIRVATLLLRGGGGGESCALRGRSVHR